MCLDLHYASVHIMSTIISEPLLLWPQKRSHRTLHAIKYKLSSMGLQGICADLAWLFPQHYGSS